MASGLAFLRFKLLRPRLVLVLAAVLFFAFQLHFFSLYNTTDSITKALKDTNGNRVYYNDKNYIASPYEKLLKHHEGNIHKLSYHEKCESYFKLLYQSESTWELTDFAELPYERYIFESKKKFIQKKLDEKFNNDPTLKALPNNERDKYIEKHDLKKLYEVEWTKVVESSRVTEQRLVDASTHLRVYGACFLDQFGKFNKVKGASTKVINDQCFDIETRMFQWLSRRLPIFKRWDGQIFNQMPKMRDFINQPDIPDYKASIHSADADFDGCYLKDLRDSFNGRGIAISAANKHFDQLINLFGVLRATGNTLPIQIVHSGDLNEETQEKIVKLARSVENLKLEPIDNLKYIIQKRNLTEEYENFNVNIKDDLFLEKLFPKQEVWFVDVSETISPKYKKKFSGYANKLLAYFFNSFQHTILIDTDTVPVVDMDEMIIHSNSYKEKGAYFFKDRELFKQNSESDEIFYTKLMTSKVDKMLFGMPEITDYTLNNRFIGGRFAHYMESGVVAVDKIKHFTGVLATIQILMWGPAASKVWGDKELFWLGMSMAGDEDYYMNHWPAGAAGEITPKSRRLINDKDDTRRSKLVGNEVCSTHPAHVSGEDNSTLLWFNSGFTFCKFLDVARNDLNEQLVKGLYENADALKEMYRSYQKINTVIVPKGAEYFVNGAQSGENSRGWEKMNICKGFTWCAYDKVGGRDLKESNGLMISIDEETQKVYDFYGSVSEHSSYIFGVSV